MQINDLLATTSIALNQAPATKQAVLEQAIKLIAAGGHLSDQAAYEAAVWARENEGTTGIGDGIAIPHGRSSGVKSAGLAAMTFNPGTEFAALDGEPVRLLFLIAAPDNAANEHIKLLSKLSTMLLDSQFKEQLLKAADPSSFKACIAKAEAALDQKKALATAKPVTRNLTDDKTQPFSVLAVTACPTGIAHTYMAQEALQKAAAQLQIAIKVETNGQTGVENALTDSEIKAADCIIVAADKQVPMQRFYGKPLIDCSVSEAIQHADKLLEQASSKNVPLYLPNAVAEGINNAADDDSEQGSADNSVKHAAYKNKPLQAAGFGTATQKESIGRALYKNLMNGVSHMLPFVIGGGILIALSFLLDDYRINPANFGANTPVAAFFKNVGGTAFQFMLPVLAGFIAMGLADRPGLMVGFVAGALANQGGAGFLGALVAGFVAGYVMRALKVALRNVPKSLAGTKSVLLYPLLGILIVGALCYFVINPPFAYLNQIIAQALASLSTTSKLVLGLILGGMMAVDMGGPINKAAYLFGTASLTQGSSLVMAAVMVGGMVPPLAIALATFIFPAKFNADEKKSSITNIIMGLSFITEGAIPFAAADPLRVIPACVIGSAIAGAFSMLFNCSLRAPHGGLWVIGVIEHPALYILALAIGTVISALVLGLLKRKQSSVD